VAEGTFDGSRGTVLAMDVEHRKISAEIAIFDRTTPVELEQWQVRKN